MPPVFGREEGAALVAVERANGGELAPLAQVLWTLDQFTPPGAQRPTAAGFSFSATLLIELGVVEYVDHQLGLTPAGRKLLRRSGLPNSSHHLSHVIEVLQEYDEQDFESQGSRPAPTEADVRQALSDGERIEETTGGVGTPVLGEEVSLYAQGLVMGSHWVPAVLPADAGPTGGDARPPADAAGFPGRPEGPSTERTHPILERLFAHRRRDGAQEDT